MSFDFDILPLVNACLNGLSASLLLAGWWCIATRRTGAHAACMISAFCVSVVFLASYLTYHFNHPSTRYGGPPPLRAVYLTILMTHMVLAALTPPMAVGAIWLAAKGKFERHKRLTRWLLPMWLYVSTTGVIIYLMLRPYYL